MNRQRDSPRHQLIHDRSGRLLVTGSYYECLARFQALCGIPYHTHKKLTTNTYTISQITH